MPGKIIVSNKTKKSVALFYNFANLFNIWINKTAGFPYLLLHQDLLQTTVLVEIYEENSSLTQTSDFLKGGLFLYPFQIIVNIFMLYQNSTSKSFLKVVCNIDSEAVSIMLH
jgi:hypothetical protein